MNEFHCDVTLLCDGWKISIGNNRFVADTKKAISNEILRWPFLFEFFFIKTYKSVLQK